MKLISFSHEKQNKVGAIEGDNIIVSSYSNMIDLLEAGQSALDQLKNSTPSLTLKDVKLLAPIPRPPKFLAIALNYGEHINETGMARPEYPMFFSKQSTCVIASNDNIWMPKVSNKLDYEGELAFVIGKRCRHVSVENAHEVIAGYMIANDVTVRDWQARSQTMMIGKSFDTCGPLGPYLVTSDEIQDPHNLSLKTWVDDELRQNANTSEMLFNCYEMIAYLSQAMTLEVGDVISTGTPSGVGVKMSPRGYLKIGQTVRIQIEGLGELKNTVIEEP